MTDETIQPQSAWAAPLGWLRPLRGLLLLFESPIAVTGAGLVLFWVIVALLAPLIAPYEPNANDYSALVHTTPSAAHWLGTDNQGRDLLSRIIWGSRTVLTVGPVAVACAYVIGCLLGLLAGYYRGWVDVALMRLTDIVLSFPIIILYIIIITTYGPSAFNIILSVTFTAAPQVVRIVRGITLELRQRDYIAAAKMRGEPAWYIMFVEILPNARGPLIVDACLRMGYTTIAIGVLGFLGLGLPPPDPDWGGMVKETYGYLQIWPHMALMPCVAIVSLVVGFNLLADGLREISARD
ncbi:MAG: ABC transporter permease [Alphaproteobacteria bacterium]|nr:ABC transporter permease [Alphaproteobacteria bacterium]